MGLGPTPGGGIGQNSGSIMQGPNMQPHMPGRGMDPTRTSKTGFCLFV